MFVHGAHIIKSYGNKKDNSYCNFIFGTCFLYKRRDWIQIILAGLAFGAEFFLILISVWA